MLKSVEKKARETFGGRILKSSVKKVTPKRTVSMNMFIGQKIRVISFYTNTRFTITPNAKSDIGISEILEYAKSKVCNDLEGIVTDVVYFSSIEMNELLEEQHDEKYFATLVADRLSCNMTLNPTGYVIWKS